MEEVDVSRFAELLKGMSGKELLSDEGFDVLFEQVHVPAFFAKLKELGIEPIV